MKIRSGKYGNLSGKYGNLIITRRKLLSFWSLFFFILTLTITAKENSNKILTGAEQPELYISKLKGKKLALVVNQTSTVGHQHLVDFLISNQLTVKKIFAPEHGFRGDAGAG